MKKIDVRVVATTNRDLRKMIHEKKAFERTFFTDRRLSTSMFQRCTKGRKENLILLQRHFLQKFNAEMNRNIKGLTLRAQQRFARYDWPGTLRVLENAIEEA